ncbi:hypothetical protein KAW80_02970 [Candidatus Babeliales bacterium]|nr:hypothetical protein [Candidatus Babeliales bacterium]
MLKILNDNKKLFLLFCLGLLIRGIVFHFYLAKNERFWNFDSSAYHEVAVEISKGEGIRNPNGSYHFYRVPGYALFSSIFYKIFGVNKKYPLWGQVVLGSLLPLLVFCLVLVLYPGNLLLAQIASLWAAFHQGFIIFSGLFMSETLFSFFFLLFLIFFLLRFEGFFIKSIAIISYKLLFISGLFLGLASLVRPVGFPIILLSIFLIFISNFSLRQKTSGSLVLFGGWFSVVFWWLLRNFLLTGYLFFQTLPGLHFLKHSAARINMEMNQVPYMLSLERVNKEYLDLCKKEECEKSRKLMEIEYCILAERVSYKYFLKNWYLTAKHAFTNMFKTSFSLYASELLFIDSGGQLPSYDLSRTWTDKVFRFLLPKVSSYLLSFFIYLEIFLFLFILIGFFAGVFTSLVNLNLSVIFKIMPFIGGFIFLSLACGFARLRLSIEPLVFIFSLNYWVSLRKK